MKSHASREQSGTGNFSNHVCGGFKMFISFSAAINWNGLPFDIRACDSLNVLERKLKSHLFNIAYAT